MHLPSAMEYDNPHTLEKLGALLEIPDLGGEDWDLIYADSHRVEEFCDVYEHSSFSESEKFALMELIVASYDRHLWDVQHEDLTLESRIERLLDLDFELHLQTIEYWSALKSPYPDSLRAVSPLMRRLIKKRETDA